MANSEETVPCQFAQQNSERSGRLQNKSSCLFFEVPSPAVPQHKTLPDHLPQNIMENPAVLVVGDLERRIDTRNRENVSFFAVRVAHVDTHVLPRLEIARQTLDIEGLKARQPERFCILAGQKFERQHAHPYQVAAMDALEAFREYRLHAEQNRSLRGPVAR